LRTSSLFLVVNRVPGRLRSTQLLELCVAYGLLLLLLANSVHVHEVLAHSCVDLDHPTLIECLVLAHLLFHYVLHYPRIELVAVLLLCRV